MWKVLILEFSDFEGSSMVDVCFSLTGGVLTVMASASLEIGSFVAPVLPDKVAPSFSTVA